MKLIFLDIDGVLNCHHTKERAPSGVIGIEDEKVRLLKQIVEPENDRHIILTSSWQGASDMDFDYMTDTLYHGGVILSDLSLTYGNWRNRGQVIRRAVTILRPSAWNVLDDDQFPDFKEYRIGSHLNQTSFYKNGLEPKHVQRAMKMLGGNV